MATRLSWVAMLLAVCALLGVCWIGQRPGSRAWAQEMGPAGAANPAPGQPNPGMAGMGGPPTTFVTSPSPALTTADGVVYVASEGTLSAFEARTLKKLGEVKYYKHPGLM